MQKQQNIEKRIKRIHKIASSPNLHITKKISTKNFLVDENYTIFLKTYACVYTKIYTYKVCFLSNILM